MTTRPPHWLAQRRRLSPAAVRYVHIVRERGLATLCGQRIADGWRTVGVYDPTARGQEHLCGRCVLLLAQRERREQRREEILPMNDPDGDGDD
jgi:hypothetical protein